MRKSLFRNILPFVSLFFMGCALQNQPVPKAHIPPEPKNQARLIERLPQNLSAKRQIIVHNAINNLGQPYVWGGKSPGIGFDCSGLVFFTHEKAGLQVPRTSKNQYNKGRPISKQSLAPGDLVFFNTPKKKTGFHVGIFIGEEQFIHAPGRGRHVSLDNLNNHYFYQNFQGARSYL